MSNLCLQLEQRLVAETQGSAQGRELLPKIENDMRTIERELPAPRRCSSTAPTAGTSSCSRARCGARSAACSSPTRPTAPGSGSPTSRRSAARSWARGERRSYQDDIIRELARNNCGPQYQQEARRRDAARNPFSSLWGEESEGPRGGANQFGNLPFATYRTLCVRLCDGYYFPVSFSTLPNHFQRDCGACASRSARRRPSSSITRTPAERSSRWCRCEPAALYRPEIGLALSQGVRAGLLVQGRRVPAAGGTGKEKKAEAPAAAPGSRRRRRRYKAQ